MIWQWKRYGQIQQQRVCCVRCFCFAVGHMPWRLHQSYWHRLHHAACHRWIGGIFAESQMFRCSICLRRWNRCPSFSLPLFAAFGLGRLSLFTHLFHFMTHNFFCVEFLERHHRNPGFGLQIGLSPFVISACRKSFGRSAFTRWIPLSLTWARGAWVIASISWHGRCGYWLWMPGTPWNRNAKSPCDFLNNLDVTSVTSYNDVMQKFIMASTTSDSWSSQEGQTDP